jgi:hypothetical protein
VKKPNDAASEADDVIAASAVSRSPLNAKKWSSGEKAKQYRSCEFLSSCNVVRIGRADSAAF